MTSRLADALIVLTRPQERNEPLARRLADRGFEPLAMPVLGISPLSGVKAPPLPADHDLIVFVSGNAVSAYFQQLAAAGELPETWPSGTLVAAVGAATAGAVARTGRVPADLVLHPGEADAQDSESLWKVLQPRLAPLRAALIVRGQNGREWLGQRLEQAGLRVTRHAAYERCAVDWPPQQVERLRAGLEAGREVICLLTSVHGVRAFIDNAAHHGLLSACGGFHYVVIHPRIAGRLQSSLDVPSDTAGRLAVTICAPRDDAILQAVTSLASL
ncbi:uroporphyrinogen-III synthase [Pusillimonas sp.]|uniref:uroporphyrinogen-III synthase n=1 Tax=Pusillimonas sp. TaxID=3040095 RepID=UPI0029B0BD17|nr:uroporphyrinogen-III synthase [Pusillimonas sp.]MDX3895776.1 uroporphyrinogen-III synthase [Pusillimonas sp.]